MIDAADLPVRRGLAAAIEHTWQEIGHPGAHWTGSERVEIVRATRAAVDGESPPPALGPAAREAAARLATAPATTTETWVTDMADALGEPAYVELVGVVARVAAVDTFFRLLGLTPLPPPQPVPGEPSGEPVPDAARRNRTWISMVTPLAPLVLGAVPSTEAAVNDLCDELYMPPSEIGDATFRRGLLDRPGMELVAATVSCVNECFY